MSQYDDRVEKQRLKLEAEEWAKGVKAVHAHSLNSMFYAEDRDDGSVLDIQYNDGSVRRTINATNEVVMLGKALKGDDLIQAYTRGGI